MIRSIESGGRAASWLESRKTKSAWSLRKQPRKISFRYPKRGRNIHGYVSEVEIHFQNHKSIPTVSSTQFENCPPVRQQALPLERFILENGIPKILRNTHVFSRIGEGATEFGFS
jgi:hypothetical protein